MNKLLEIGLWGFLGYCLGRVAAVAIVCYTIYVIVIL